MTSASTLQDGVVDYPITAGMALGGVWQYSPNTTGPIITTKQDKLSISRGPINASNQWTYLSIKHDLKAQGGTSIGFKLKLDNIGVSKTYMSLSMFLPPVVDLS